MAAPRGERFEIDLSDENIAPDERPPEIQFAASSVLGDIAERTTTSPKPPAPAPPKSGSSSTGWPLHRKRHERKPKPSVPLEDNDSKAPPMLKDPFASPATSNSLSEQEKQQIDAENRRRIAEMSPEEIAQERRELFAALNPALIEKLLKRATIDDEPLPNPLTRDTSISNGTEGRRPSNPGRKVSFAIPELDKEDQMQSSAESHSLPLASPAPSISNGTPMPKSPDIRRPSSAGRKVSFATPISADEDTQSTAESHSLPPTPPGGLINGALLDEQPSMHFPKPPAGPNLDPNSETFFDDLHTKYFPSLSHDPSKLDWMKPADPEDNASYDPSQESVSPLAIRFSFAGQIIPPSLSMSLPTDIGLHHHGDAPDAAGYTIPELAHLARSSYPGQRCIAIQTLGRILYRLGKGEFGNENDIDVHGPDGDGERALLAKGLWEAIEEGRVIDTITEESKKERGHRTSIALAQEAVWNWQRGGGRQRKAV